MAAKNYHVVPRKEGWAIQREGASKASSLHDTQKDAIQMAREHARSAKSEVVIHRPDGKIRDKDSYGNDPCPPKDTKH